MTIHIKTELYEERNQEAIRIVKQNHYLLSDFIKNGIPTVSERVRSFTSSLISIHDDISGGKLERNELLEALNEEDDDIHFIYKQITLINNLEPKYSDLLKLRYFKHVSFAVLREGGIYNGDEYAANTNLPIILNESYRLIALFDDEVDYSIDDYVYTSSRTINNTVKELVLVLLAKALYSNPDNQLSEVDLYNLEVFYRLKQSDRKIVEEVLSRRQSNQTLSNNSLYRSSRTAIKRYIENHKELSKFIER